MPTWKLEIVKAGKTTRNKVYVPRIVFDGKESEKNNKKSK